MLIHLDLGHPQHLPPGAERDTARRRSMAPSRAGRRASSARSCTSSPFASNAAASPRRRRSRHLLLHADSTVAAPSPWRARPLRARRRAVTAPSPQPSPAPPLVLEGKAIASLLQPQRRRRAARELCAACAEKASLPSLAYLSIGDVTRGRGAGYIDLA